MYLGQPPVYNLGIRGKHHDSMRVMIKLLLWQFMLLVYGILHYTIMPFCYCYYFPEYMLKEYIHCVHGQ